MAKIQKFINENKQALNNHLKRFWIIYIVVFIVQAIFITSSKIYYQIGFPLDDSWIHQTYARNLLIHGDWYFLPGVKSAGSTAPLWTLLLVPGHLFNGTFPIIWTFFISGLFYAVFCIVMQILFESFQTKTLSFPWIGVVLALEWHLVWAANSGMETILFILIISLFFLTLAREDKYPAWFIGFLVGIIIFVRPDGITLLGPYLFVKAAQIYKNKIKFASIAMNLIIIIIFIGLFGLFNFRLSGDVLPNTFYAKQAEYQIMFTLPLFKRIIKLFLIPLTGVGIVLIPGFLVFLYKKIKELNFLIISMYLWLFGYLLIYAIRLPVTYQHGRYVMPIIPLFILLSCLGIYEISKLNFKFKSLIVFAYKFLLFSVLILFLILGGQAYSRDVAIIQSEMVATAKWINENIDNSKLIAAHDIGALGFFSDHKIIDLAGLINPEIIPIIRNEQKIKEYLNENNVEYLVVFPGWYETLDKNREVVFATNGIYSPQFGGENMKVFTWE